MGLYSDFIDSDIEGTGLFQYRLFFELEANDLCPDGFVGYIRIWDSSGNTYDFDKLTKEDQTKIREVCKSTFDFLKRSGE